MAGGTQRGQVHLDSLPANWPGPAGLRDEAPWTAATRRVLDVAFSLALLTFTLPLTLLLACLVRLDSSGPAFYRQERVGLHGNTEGSCCSPTAGGVGRKDAILTRRSSND